MGNEIKRYVIRTFIFTWILWGLLISLIKLNITTFGTPLAMILFVFGGIMPAIVATSLKKNMDQKKSSECLLKILLILGITLYGMF